MNKINLCRPLKVKSKSPFPEATNPVKCDIHLHASLHGRTRIMISQGGLVTCSPNLNFSFVIRKGFADLHSKINWRKGSDPTTKKGMGCGLVLESRAKDSRESTVSNLCGV